RRLLRGARDRPGAGERDQHDPGVHGDQRLRQDVGGLGPRLRRSGRSLDRARPRAASEQGNRLTAHVVIAGGGTGGHTSPGLAVAAVLRERSIACAWIGSRSGIEAQRVPPTGIPYVAIATGKLRRYWAWQNVGDLAVNVPMGMLCAFNALRVLRLKVVFGTGGYVALPGMLATAVSRVPHVLPEQYA